MFSAYASASLNGNSQDFKLSSNLERLYLKFSVERLCSTPAFADIFGRIQKYRQFVRDHVSRLMEIRQIANAYRTMSEEWGFNFTFPKLLSDEEHTVTFKEIIPVHLIGRKMGGGKVLHSYNLVPIQSFGDLNGRMLGLTGPNGEGKTVTEEALLDAIYDAHSGLPIFGSGFALNVKKALAAVFPERGDGSACELMLVKMKNVLEALQQLPANQTVLVIDELGGFTQEDSGLGIGSRFLRTISNHKCSTVFATQITELAEFAERELGAFCCKVTSGHQIVKGIGRGMAEELAVRVGLDAMLAPSEKPGK
jgi:hypothetical protein